MAKQIKFKDLDDNTIHGGILLDNGDVVCGCCGGLFEEIEKGITWECLTEMDDWINLDDAILDGDI